LDAICCLLFRQQIWSILLSKKQFAWAAANVLQFDDVISCQWGCNEFQQTANWSIILKNCYLKFAVVPVETLLLLQKRFIFCRVAESKDIL
jgi:hypothetical protein